MARLDNWLSAPVLHALGWALVHSLWQCLGLAALAAILMAFSRRPPIRYLVATGALIAMLAAPVATFIVLMKPAAPVHALPSASPGPSFFAGPEAANPPGVPSMAFGGASTVVGNGAAFALESPKRLLPSRFSLPDFLPPNSLSWLVGAWLCGVALFSLRLAGGFLLLEHKRRRQSGVLNPHILTLCHELQRQLGLSRAIRYLDCSWLQAPAVIGWLRPIVLLPVSALTGLSEVQLRAVIAHELAHIRRLDCFVNLLQILVETLLFYHPAIWWLNKRIRTERELCCDEIAVSLTGDRLEYAKVLTLMAEWEKAPALAMAANRGPLSQRVFHILGQKPFGAGQRALGLTGSILFLAAALGAANALFGIAYPIPAAQAKASLAAAPSSKLAVLDPVAPQALEASEPPAKDAATDQSGGPEMAAPEPKKVAAIVHVKEQAVPSPDLSPLLLTEALGALATPNESPAAPDTILAAAARVTTRPKAPTCALPSVVDAVALKEVPDSNLRTVPVVINGTSKQFLLDIGTSPTEISQAAAADLALPDADSAAEPMFANGQRYFQSVALIDVKSSRNAEDYRPHVRIDSFTLGDATGRNLAFLVAKDPEMGKSKPYDGLLTGDFSRQYDVELDFAQNKLTYLTPTGCIDPDQVAYWPHSTVAIIPMAMSGGKIVVQVSILGHVINAVVDMSSPHTVMRRDIAERMMGLKPNTPGMMPDGDREDGWGLRVYKTLIQQISFAGGVTAVNVPVQIQTNGMIHIVGREPLLGSRAQFADDQRIPDLTLGMDVLHQLHIYIVPAQGNLYVTSAN